METRVSTGIGAQHYAETQQQKVQSPPYHMSTFLGIKPSADAGNSSIRVGFRREKLACNTTQETHHE